ncbi:hypothetical protein ACFL5Z_03870 [Planctomycetota bacterium]
MNDLQVSYIGRISPSRLAICRTIEVLQNNIFSHHKVFILGQLCFFMTEVDLQAGLRSLRASLRQMESLLAWEQLKRAEAKPGQPPAFQEYDPTETDLKNEYSSFLSTSVQIHSILNDSSSAVAIAELQSIKRQLNRIDKRANALNLHQRFCHC